MPQSILNGAERVVGKNALAFGRVPFSDPDLKSTRHAPSYTRHHYRDHLLCALAATHDNELVDLLSETFTVCHFEDTLRPEGLTFTYHLTPGPALSRNAIALLKLNGAPESVIRQALARAAELDGHWRNAVSSHPR
jgi:hypothetical protein